MTRLGASLRGERACASFHAALAIMSVISSPESRNQWKAERPFVAIHILAGTRRAPVAAALRSYPHPLTGILPNRQVVEAPAARAAKSLNASAERSKPPSPPNRSYSPLCPCKAPPNFCHPVVRRCRRGMAPDYSSPRPVDRFKFDGENRDVGRTLKLTNASCAGSRGRSPEIPVHRRHLPYP